MPIVLPLLSSTSCELNKIFSSPILSGILVNDYSIYRNTGVISQSWCVIRDLMIECGGKFPIRVETPEVIIEGKVEP